MVKHKIKRYQAQVYGELQYNGGVKNDSYEEMCMLEDLVTYDGFINEFEIWNYLRLE